MRDTSWIVEGFRQFQLGTLWACIAHLLEKRSSDLSSAGVLAQRLRQEVLQPFVARCWLPKVDLNGWLCHDLPQRWSNTETDCLFEAERLPAEVFHTWFNADWHEKDVAKAVRNSLLATLNTIKRDDQKDRPPPIPAEPEPPHDASQQQGPSVEEMVALWIQEGRSLLRWRKLTSEIFDPIKAEQNYVSQEANRLRGKCQALEPEALRRKRGPHFSRLLRDPWEVEFLEGLHQTMVSCQELLGKIVEQCCELDEKYAVAMGPYGPLLKAKGSIETRLQQWDDDGWPPVWLADMAALMPGDAEAFFQSLDSGTAGLERAAEPGGGQPRIGLLLRTIDAIDRHPAVASIDWLRIQEQACLLVPNAKLVRPLPADAPEGIYQGFQLEESPTVAEPRVKETGVYVAGRTVRTAVLLKPSSSRRTVNALEDLADRLPATARSLRDLCRSLATKLLVAANLKTWWATATEDDRGDLWFLVQRAFVVRKLVPEMRGEIGLVLHELQQAGFRLDQSPPSNGSLETAWLIWSEGREQTKGGDFVLGGTVVGPDGIAIAPAVWIVPSSSVRGVERLAKLAENARLVRWHDPEAAQWKPAVDAFLAATQDPDRSDEEAMVILHRLHTRLESLRQGNATTPVTTLYKQMVCGLWDYLQKDRGLQLWPSLDEDGSFSPADPIPNWVELVLEPSDLPAGRVLRVERFSTGGQRVRWWISHGPTIPPGLATWWNLPSPDSLQLRHKAPEPLIQWHKKLARLALRPQGIQQELERARQRFQDCLKYTDNQEWFDALVREAHGGKDGGTASGEWLNALRSLEWCRCYPEPADTGGWVWPIDASIEASGIEWEEAAEVPPRSVIGPVVRFAAEPNLAQCKLSLGVLPVNSSLRLALDLKGKVRELSNTEGWLPLVDRLVRFSLQDWFRNVRADVGACVPPLLDGMLKVARKNADLGPVDPVPPIPGRIVVFDEWLHIIRGWCAAYDTIIVPEDWRFSKITACPLPSDDSMTVSYAFTTSPSGTVLLRRFGLVEDGQVLTAAEGTVSAGPMPPSYVELTKSAEGSSTEAEELLSTLRQWPRLAAAEGKEIESLASDLFRDYWWRRISWDQHDPSRCREFHAQLESMLDSLGCWVRTPELGDVHDASWVTIENARPGARRIALICRPGLFRREDNAVLVNAEVELE